MLDIIIPVYNNAQELPNTLFSLTHINFPFQVYVVDDGSDNPVDYDNIGKFFTENFFSTTILHLPENSGPGIARQYGLDNSFDEFILFIDCGDLLVNFNQMLPYIIDMQRSNIISTSFGLYVEQRNPFSYENWKESSQLVTQIIKRSFIEQYQIRFNPECSYYFEDVGFSNIITMIVQNSNGQYLTAQCHQSLMVYTYNAESLTKKDNYGSIFTNIKCQAINTIYAIEYCRKLYIKESVIQKSIYEGLMCLYMNYIKCKDRYPLHFSYIQDALSYYYNTYFKNQQINPTLLLSLYHAILPTCGYEITKFPFVDFIQVLESLESFN